MFNSAASRLIQAPFSESVVIDTARETLRAAGGQVSCGFVFASAEYRPHLSDFLELVQLHGHVPTLVGCSASGLIGKGIEAEHARGFSLLLLNLPNTQVHTVALSAATLEEAEEDPTAWHRATGVTPEQVDTWTILADPTSWPIEQWLSSWNLAYPGIASIGGAASGGRSGQDIFLCQDRALIDGAVAVGFKGGVRIETLVSQGCRPIGEPFTITGTDKNFVTSLGSRPAYEILQQTFDALPEVDKALAQGNIFAGLAMSEYVDEFKTGDFVIRNLLGADPENGVLALGAHPRVGQTLQFQLRDRQSADVELRHMAASKRKAGVHPFASLLFPCLGRGHELFGVPNHDSSILQTVLGGHAAAGYFCNGEIGPVGGKNFIHGYTASAALFADP